MGCMSSKKISILVLIGSARQKSANRGIINEIQRFSFEGISQIVLNIPSLEQLPMFSEDQQQKNPIPQEVQNLRAWARESAGILFVTPEINGSLSPLILNAFVWLSRSYNEKEGPPIRHKKVAIASASFLSKNQIVDCIDIGKQLNMRFMEASFHIFLGNKAISQSGKMVSASEKERLEKWYKEFIKYLKSKQ